MYINQVCLIELDLFSFKVDFSCVTYTVLQVIASNTTNIKQTADPLSVFTIN